MQGSPLRRSNGSPSARESGGVDGEAAVGGGRGVPPATRTRSVRPVMPPGTRRAGPSRTGSTVSRWHATRRAACRGCPHADLSTPGRYRRAPAARRPLRPRYLRRGGYRQARAARGLRTGGRGSPRAGSGHARARAARGPLGARYLWRGGGTARRAPRGGYALGMGFTRMGFGHAWARGVGWAPGTCDEEDRQVRAAWGYSPGDGVHPVRAPVMPGRVPCRGVRGGRSRVLR